VTTRIFRLTFPRSASHPEVVRLASGSAGYREVRRGRRLTHVATFGTSKAELARLAALWRQVRWWKGATLEIEGVRLAPRERGRIGEILECMERAVTVQPLWEYCASGPPESEHAPWPGRPALPCRLAARQLAPLLDEQVAWDDPTRRLDELAALLGRTGYARCPFLRLGAFETALTAWRPGPDGARNGGPRPGQARRGRPAARAGARSASRGAPAGHDTASGAGR
jgi:hypothetical protein